MVEARLAGRGAAVGANPVQDNVHLVASKTVTCRGLDQGDGVDPDIEILNPSTGTAHAVLVGIAAPIEERNAGTDIDLTRQAELDKQIKGRVDRRDRDSREVPRHRVADLLGRGVAPTTP